MSQSLSCYRCGESLASLSLPLSRRDACPECAADLHVCKMCVFFSATAPRQCLEDGAEDVKEKERPNFCDWFKPSDSAYDAAAHGKAKSAASELEALFGDGSSAEAESSHQSSPELSDADKLFK